MTIRPKVVMQAAAIVLILTLFPGTARLQEQKEPPVPQQEETAVVPDLQKPGESVAPEGATSTEPANRQPGQVVAPNEGDKAVESADAETASASRESTQYIIKKGDTLWDIANTFFRDPFLWPFIWKANPPIKNPDLIYPGNKLEIPSLAPIERALKAPAVTEPKEQLVEKKKQIEEEQVQEPKPREGIASAGVIKPKPAVPETVEETPVGSLLVMPEEQLLPIIDKYAMLSAGFVNTEENDGRIVGTAEDSKTIFGYGDVVFVKIPASRTVNLGDKFLIFASLNTVDHPKKRKRYGKLIRGLGILQITAKGSRDIHTAKITLSFDTIEIDSMLTPYQEPALIYNSSQRKAKDISGYILEVTDKRTINGQLNFVYLDKGNKEGVEPGDRFRVYAEAEDRSFPDKLIGEVQVFIVKDRTATAVVTKSSEVLEKGNIVEFKK